MESSMNGGDGPGDAATEPAHINALPAELFLDILQWTLDFEATFIPQLHILSQVCIYWSRSILSDPRFWRVIDFENRDLAPVVLRRNPSGPLTVRCRLVGDEGPIDGFIEIVKSEAHRWEELEFFGALDQHHMRLFDLPTPALVKLISSATIRDQFPHFHSPLH